MAEFPKGRVLRRIYIGTTRTLTTWLGGIVVIMVFAFIGAFFTLPTNNNWGQRFWNGLLVAIVAIVLVMAGAIVLQLVRHRRSGYRDENWEANCHLDAGNACTFWLQKRPGTAPGTFEVHGIMECIIRLPSGEFLTIPDGELRPAGGHTLTTMIIRPPEPGDYEVRWYGSEGNRRKFYEITRATFTK